MGATLDALHRLQEIELHITEIRQEIDRKVRVLTRQQKRIAELDAAIAAQQGAIRHDQMEADRLDLDVKSREAEIAKLRQALNAAKTNKEYSAILMQLNTHKADNSKVEERVLALLTQIDGKKKELSKLHEEKNTELAKQAEFQSAVRSVEEQSKDRLARLHAERSAAAAAVPPSALECFNRVSRKLEGQAMAIVTRTNPKRPEYACGGCNMAINIEQVNAIMSRDEAVLCHTCGRILYLEEPATSNMR
jgi:predicted  nucleic acid-binding Zn-ribbon protein